MKKLYSLLSIINIIFFILLGFLLTCFFLSLADPILIGIFYILFLFLFQIIEEMKFLKYKFNIKI